MKKVRKADPRDGWYLVEPIDAQGLLDTQPKNRALRESKAVRFSKDMELTKWRPNGEPLILDEKDLLLDGQGRCRACVISGKPFETYVVHGIPRKFFSTVDTGQARTGADTLNLTGYSNYAIAAAVARLAIVCSRGSGSSMNRTVTNWELAEYARKNADRMNRALEDVQPYTTRTPLPPSQLAYIYMEALDINEQKAREWMVGVALGENLPQGSPMLALRNRLIALRGDQHKAQGYEKLAWAIKSWNAHVVGRKVTMLKWTSRLGGRNAEAYPVITDGAEEVA